MSLLTCTTETKPPSGFDFPLPEELPSSLQQLPTDWWINQYRMAVIALRSSQVDLAASRSYHQNALQREEALQIEIEDLKARIRQREKALFARRSEQSQSKSESQSTNAQSKHTRGQQRNNSGPKRRHHEHLESKEVFYDVPDEQKACLCCGLPFTEFPTTEDSEQLEIEIQAYRRILKRKRYKKTCQCETMATMLTAPRCTSF